MAGRGAGPDFVESLARGLDVLACFDAHHGSMTLSEVATDADLARPTARRLLLTLEELGYVRAGRRPLRADPEGAHARHGLRRRARPLGHRPPAPEGAGERTGESSSMAQLDGRDIIYVARVAVPKIVALRSDRHPLPGGGHLDGQGPARRAHPGATGQRACGGEPFGYHREVAARPRRLDRVLREVRAKGWALADQDLAPGVRSIATGGTRRRRQNRRGREHHRARRGDIGRKAHWGILPLLLHTAAEIGHDWALLDSVPTATYLPENNSALRT